MITTRVPDSWQDLQVEVAKVLKECGFTVEVEKVVNTVRGTVELDVYAVESIHGRTYSIICECKHWKQNIPQTIVHALRTVVGDFGANIGYLLVTSGFQPGARAAANMANIELTTWEEFLVLFEPVWLEKHLIPTVTKELDRLIEYTEPLVPNWFLNVSGADKVVLRKLREKYSDFGMLMMMFTAWNKLAGNQLPQLPLRDNDGSAFPGGRNMPDSILSAPDYRVLLEACLEYGIRGTNEFEDVRERNKDNRP